MHGSKLALTTWFQAAWLMATHKNGFSARQMREQLGLGSSKSAWLLCAKLRRAMVAPERNSLTGLVVPRDPDLDDLVSSPATYTNDVGGGHCVDFTKPNRVLEEFDFYTVVRTTEPEIVGMTVGESPKVPLSDVLRLIDPKIANLLLQTQSTATLFEPQAEATPQVQILQQTSASPQGSGGATLGINVSDLETVASHALTQVRPELQHLSEAISLASLPVGAREEERPARQCASGPRRRSL
jgi:hypothetical protein